MSKLRRSPREIAFRVRQEMANLALLFSKPSPALEQKSPLEGLPDPTAVASCLGQTHFAAEVVRLAEGILQHRFPLLGIEIEAGPSIDWRRDYVSVKASGKAYFRRIPYLDFSRVGDHKVIWELNRHQHMVLLAQAFLFTGRREFLDEIESELESWAAQNPYMRGINWASALEVAFRALSWTWVYHLAGNHLNAPTRRLLLRGLYLHAKYLEHNLSVYFSPNTHLLGEAVALHALGALFPGFPGAETWKQTGGRIVREEMERQVQKDGSHFEHSTYYHVYALDLFLFHSLLAHTPAWYREKLQAMAGYLSAVMGPARLLPFLGDDDGGRLFHPYGARNRFGCATLATCAVLFKKPEWYCGPQDLWEQAAWWLGPEAFQVPLEPDRVFESRLFPKCGTAVLVANNVQVLVDTGTFGYGGAGHSHSDTLALMARSGEQEVLIDPGTYTYVADPAWREWFRGSSAHNTVRIDGLNQSKALGPFRWADKPAVRIVQWTTSREHDFLDAVCAYNGFEHRRKVLFIKPAFIFVLDRMEGSGEHLLEQFWHLGSPAIEAAPGIYEIGEAARLVVPRGATADFAEGVEYGWRSDALGVKSAAPAVRVSQKAALPAHFAAVLDFSGSGGTAELRIEFEGNDVRLEFESNWRASAAFGAAGLPRYRVT